MRIVTELRAFGEHVLSLSHRWKPHTTLTSAAIRVGQQLASKRAQVTVIGLGDGANDRRMTALSLVDALGTKLIVNPPSTVDAVTSILRASNKRPLAALTIEGHGKSGSQRLGNERWARLSDGVLDIDPMLWHLRGALDEKSVVTLGGCNTGDGPEGEKLLRELVKLWGSEVRAAESAQYVGSPGLEGPVLSCFPDRAQPDGVRCVRAPHEWLLGLYR